MNLELISFPICPYVQRAVITLLHKGVDFKLTHIDLAAKPDWFLALSPLGKVPVLKVGDAVLFESSAINEYIDETRGPRMLPDDPLERARARAWIAFGSTVMSDVTAMMMAGDERAFAAAEATTCDHLQQLERGIRPDPFYDGDRFGLVDSTFAPVFLRLEWVMSRRPLRKVADLAGMSRWSHALLELPEVRMSVREDFEDLLFDHMAGKGSILTRPIP